MRLTFCTILLLPLSLAFAQEAPFASLPKFQEFANPNDERVKVFMELEAKAEAGDGELLAKAGEYYFHGRFPVTQNQVRASEMWIKGASLGSFECANLMAFAVYEHTGNDSERIIEKLKWEMVGRQFGSFGFASRKGPRGFERIKVFTDPGEFPKPDSVSDSSFNEAKRRASDFLSTIKLTQGMHSHPVAERGMAPAASSDVQEITVPSPSSIRDAQAFRMALLADFRRIQSKITKKIESATPEDLSDYALIARKLEAVQQKGLGSSTPSTLTSGALGQFKMARAKELREQLSAFKINTAPPFTRQDLNQAQAFLDRYRDLLDTIEKGH